MWIARFDVGMKVVLNVKVSCTVGVGANQNPAENPRQRGRDLEMSAREQDGTKPPAAHFKETPCRQRDAAHERGVNFFSFDPSSSFPFILIKKQRKDKKV